MKKHGWLIVVLLIGKCYAQQYSSTRVDTLKFTVKGDEVSVMVGSCASPDGSNTQIAAPPPDWQWLSDNGYCYTGAPMPAKNIIMCFTLTSPGTSIDFNAGFTTTGCAGYGVNYARLYTCSPACVLVDGTALGTTTGLTVGTCYTWCISLSGVGPPSCQFTSLCPYYQDVTPMPVKLLDFKCDHQYNTINLTWSVASEFNVDKYVIECSNDFEVWEERYTMPASNSQLIHAYTVFEVETYEYYRLIEKDYDGYTEILKIISCDNRELLDISWKLYTLYGQLVLTGKGVFDSKTRDVSSGIYLLEQTINGKVSYQKIIR